ncbi:hypothetical protein ERO13_D02G048500v2 [Gossypium hirsutum]|uniref:Uncharacterized protein n=1 Tax=Gossypium barbadense TaxID=3634 RepID=A0A5J5SB34_GOSBA|nr:hypothetical protein ES319_D02G054800v1 [Gossypium barbadense]KAB2040068.1 hypothetical protein ES319_D02G054800v1 [Gossypium barbadense]KAG4157214.1 hypothetical protein ERO13_D02G048500v2 [Gossypium hirsutum]KAG4157215.1 hypothetical protein ERO13_D02G048500v2 [Gossypium hirsutum]
MHASRTFKKELSRKFVRRSVTLATFFGATSGSRNVFLLEPFRVLLNSEFEDLFRKKDTFERCAPWILYYFYILGINFVLQCFFVVNLIMCACNF